jgi:hypothetical protein
LKSLLQASWELEKLFEGLKNILKVQDAFDTFTSFLLTS